MQLTLTLTQSLPTLSVGETFLCILTTAEGASHTVEAVGYGTVYTCNITGRLPETFLGLVTGMVAPSSPMYRAP